MPRLSAICHFGSKGTVPRGMLMHTGPFASGGRLFEFADLGAAFNLVVCYFALGDRSLMRRGFQRLIALPMPGAEEAAAAADATDDDDAGVDSHKLDDLGEYLKAQ